MRRIERWLRRFTPRTLARRAALFVTRPDGEVDFGDFGRLTPISDNWGYDRGTPVDRYYVEAFLASHAEDVRGDVLEVGDATYTRRFGGDRVGRSEVLDVVAGHPDVTMVGDLTRTHAFEPDRFDCMILTQTLPVVEDPEAAVRSVHRLLRPGGVVLATTPGICKIARDEMDRWGHHFSFTSLSARRLFEKAFGTGNVEVEAVGNVLAAAGFLYGLAAEDLPDGALTHHDQDYELSVLVRAVKAR